MRTDTDTKIRRSAIYERKISRKVQVSGTAQHRLGVNERALLHGNDGLLRIIVEQKSLM